MKVRFWGTRGSVPTPRAEMTRHGGNTSCVEVITDEPYHLVALDAGTGICALGAQLPADISRVDVLLTHLHMDHVLGLGFFDALFRPDLEVHLWGPASSTSSLGPRLTRYLSPPLFPVRLRELPCQLTLHDVPIGSFEIPNLHIDAAHVCHPGPTVGYRLTDGSRTLTYLPDHEPALATPDFPQHPDWTSGFDLAARADLLIHDAQFADHEYAAHQGHGHSAIDHALKFAALAEVRHLVAFHHDPGHDDDALDRLWAPHLAATHLPFALTVAQEGLVVDVDSERVRS